MEEAMTELTFFLCGDVMLGRGVDQILRYHVNPQIFEGYMKSALGYVQIAEERYGPIPRNQGPEYVWGKTIEECNTMGAKVRIINLETSITDRGVPWAGKSIQYRVHPGNIDVLKAMNVTCASLGNNHVLDWGYLGLTDTLQTLKSANIACPGAGETLADAERPAIIPIENGHRALVFAFGDDSSGIFPSWKAAPNRGGVNYINLSSLEGVKEVKRQIDLHRKDGDLIVTTIHQGPNWGYKVDSDFKKFAFALVDDAKVDMVHCHSSHHFKGISVYKSKLILWGCGDFITDYEGISGHENFRGDLGFMYFPKLDVRSGNLKSLTLTPTLNRHLTINYPPAEDREWMFQKMKEECSKFGTTLMKADDLHFSLKWE